jgi:hypothetical protein
MFALGGMHVHIGRMAFVRLSPERTSQVELLRRQLETIGGKLAKIIVGPDGSLRELTGDELARYNQLVDEMFEIHRQIGAVLREK